MEGDGTLGTLSTRTLAKGDFSGADLVTALGDPEFGGLFDLEEFSSLFLLGGIHLAPLWPPFSLILISNPFGIFQVLCLREQILILQTWFHLFLGQSFGW